ncbi:unnamed protein product [Angiostrongylus costaricensis]|uniref:Zinc metalloproteinase n=1 Tax=Angiostrongylus costaricensis TaxID=334426 RepID=A0A158PGH0_ANGCS|nr:unnamed protein product [Angiostrongylus costaricensis]
MLTENSPFADAASIDRHLGNMAKLNEIQSKIFGIRPTSRDQLPFEEEPAKPDQLPYLFEGDIVLTDEQMETILRPLQFLHRNTEEQLLSKNGGIRERRSLTSDLYGRWQTFPIPYYINTGSGVSESAVLAGVKVWETETCLSFRRQPSRTRGNGLEFFLGNGCFSMVGRVGFTFQQVSIGFGCTSLGIVAHEIGTPISVPVQFDGHALGFYHEQSRYDRDKYVRMLTGNIQNGYVAQFTRQSRRSMEDYGVGYDYGSVMHYGQFSFSQNGLPTINTIDTDYQQTIGQRGGPSFMDVKRINLAYCNGTCSNTLPCLHGGYTDPKNCASCRCPTGFAGVVCDQAAPNPGVCGVGGRNATSSLQSISVSGAVSCSFVIKAIIDAYTITWIKDTVHCLNFTLFNCKLRAHSPPIFRFCRSRPKNSVSETNILVVLYRGSSNTAFTLSYRYGVVIYFLGFTL